MRSLVVSSLAAVALLSPAVALAGDPAAAEALFLQGRAAVEKGDHQTACTKFAESNRLDPAVGTVFNLGDCSEKLGKLATAWQYFREVIQRLPPNDDRVPMAKQRAAALEARLPKLTVRLGAGAPAGTKITRDGIELGAASLGVALPVDPGAHIIEASAPGTRPGNFAVTLAEGEARTVDVKPGDATQGEGTASTGEGGRRTWGWVAGGVGAAGILVGTTAGVLALGKKSTVDANCDDAKRCNQTGIDAADAGSRLATVSTVGLLVGAVGVGVGAYLLVTSPTATRPETALVPTVGPTGGGLSWLGRF